MRKTLLIWGLLLAAALSARSQNLSINYQAESKPLSQVFKELEKTYDLFFAYSPGQVKGKKVTIQASNESIQSFLDRLLRPHQLVYEQIEQKYISVKTPESIYLRAQVFDFETAEPLPFATARLKNSYLGGVADQNGQLSLFIDRPLDAVLEFSFLGYHSQSLELNDYRSGTPISISLEPITQTLDEVVVKEYLNSGIASDEKASSFKILPQQMAVLPGLSERDVLLSAQVISGINSNDETASGLNVRGSARNNTFIFWNNIPMYQSAHYFGNISSYIPSSISEMNVYKNYVPVKYGGASAGLLTLDSRIIPDGEKVYEASLNMTHLDLYAKLPFRGEKGAFMIAGRRSYNELLPTPTFNAISDKLFEGSFTQELQPNGFRYNSDISFGDLNFQWLYEPNGSNTWKLSFLHSASALNYSSELEDISGEEELTQTHDVNNTGFNLDWQHRMADNMSSELSLSWVNYDLDYALTTEIEDGTNEFTESEKIFNRVNNLEFRANLNHDLNSTQFLSVGYQLNHLDVDNQILGNSFFEQDDDDAFLARGFVHSLFGEFFWDPTNRLEIVAATRFSHYGPSSKFILDGQLRANYNLNQHLVLKSAIGHYNQYLTAVQENEFSFSNTVEQLWILADDDDAIPIIRARQTSLGLLYKNNGWLIDLDLYQKNINGILALNLGFRDTEHNGLDPGEERIQGLDLTLMKRWNNWRAWSSYSFQDSQVAFEAEEFNGATFASSLNIRHQLKTGLSITTGPMELSLGYSFKTGLPMNKINGLEFVDGSSDEDEEDEEESYYRIIRDGFNSGRQPNYHRVDASVWYKFSGRQHSKRSGEIGISLINLFNTRNFGTRAYAIDGQFDDDPDTMPVVTSRDRILLGFTPNFSIRLRF